MAFFAVILGIIGIPALIVAVISMYEGQKDVSKLIQSCLKLICILLVSYIEDVWFCLQSVWYTALAKQYRNTLVQMPRKRRYRNAAEVQEKVQESACWLMEVSKKEPARIGNRFLKTP